MEPGSPAATNEADALVRQILQLPPETDRAVLRETVRHTIALPLLEVALAKTLRHYKDAKTPGWKRTAALRQLGIMIEHFEILGHGELLQPARDVFYAIAGLDLGQHDPLIAPDLKAKPRIHASEVGFRAWAAAAMEFLIRAGHSKTDAKNAVAKRLSVRGGRAITGIQVAKWRDEMGAERPSEHRGAERYQRLLENGQGSDPKGFAEQLLQKAPLPR
jgi:hypothetical protein